MLPSKGYFSGISCPFYDSSTCERPHCHFRHSKKDRTNTTEEIPTSGNVMQELVTETVRHVLSHTENTENTHLNTDGMVVDVVKTFQPGIESKIDSQKKDHSNSGDVPSYKPTPISELNRKHIPVVYAPTRPVYLDRFKRKEIKESVLYTPKSISENYTPSTTYIPSSSNARCEAYSPESVGSYKYYTSQITDHNLVVANNKLIEESDVSNILKNYDKEVENQALEALDKLIEDEFDNKPLIQPDLSGKSNINLSKDVESSTNVSDKNLNDGSHQSLQLKTTKAEESVLKNKSSKHSHSKSKGHSNDSSLKRSFTHEKHTHSKSKSSFSDISSKSNNLDEKQNHSKTSHSNDSVSKHNSSHEKHGSSRTSSHEKRTATQEKHKSSEEKHTSSHSHSKSKSHSNDNPSKHISSREKHSHSKTNKSHSSDSSSKSNINQEKYKAKGTSKKCVKDKNKSSRNKEKSKSSNSSSLKEKKACTKVTSIEKKLLKKKEEIKEDYKKLNKKNELSAKEKSSKDSERSKKNSDDNHKVLKSDSFFKSDSVSSVSDLEEVQCLQEPILIDSSSSCSFISDQIEEFSQHSQSPEINSDNDSEIVLNALSSPSASEYACDSPPPTKRVKEDDEATKLTSTVFTSSIFSDRWKKARETVKKSSAAGKIKIAFVPNVTSILTAKDKIIAKSIKSPTKDDLTQSKKTEDINKEPSTGKRARKAHIPSQDRMKYPSLIIEENLKVPVSIRQSCLNNLFDEYLKYCNEEDAKVKAQTDEIEICRRVHVPKTYQNAIALSLLKIRKMKGKTDTDLDMSSSNMFSSNSVPEFTFGWTLYKCFAEYLMTEEEFVSHGFPVEIESKPGCAYIEKTARRYDVKQPDDPSLRICANCSNSYYVDDKGFPIKEYDCFYHWGRLGRTRVRLGGITEFYRCCNGEFGSEPCTNGRYHVCNSYDEDCLEGFVESRTCTDDPEKAGIYAMDCEMCYTTKGLDLTRCTVVDINGKMVYDEVVIPESPILDYNTRFSGITEEMILKARKKLRHVQRDLLKFVNEKTILVGHSLENDFKALRLLHRTVVDTSIVFPHHLGLPYKRALKLIAKDILKINIQENESGHDSYEDSNTCMQIMMARIKEEAKKRKPRVIISLDSKSKTKSLCPR